MPEKLRDFLLHKITGRIAYIVGAYLTSRLVASVSSDFVQNFLSNIPGVKVSIVVTDSTKLQGAIVMALLVGGEFLYNWAHTKFILPKVAPQQGEVK